MRPDGTTRHAPQHVIITALGTCQILAWGSSLYLLAVLAPMIARDTGWSMSSVVAGQSISLLAAGCMSPLIGTFIRKFGGRLMLAFSAGLIATGLYLLSLASNPQSYFAAWIIAGTGMGIGLYDAAFATLGDLYGDAARKSITNLTLFGGFASTICWPLTAYLADLLGWRGACAVYAAIQLLACLPVYLFALPSREHADRWRPANPAGLQFPIRKHILVLLGAILTSAAFIASVISVLLLSLLQAQGLTPGIAVALGVVVGPAQVGARIVELAFGRHYHPNWTMLGSVILVLSGIVVLQFQAGAVAAAVALILYGAGNGVGSIAKGTVPLALFGAERYAAIMSRLAMPSLLAQAAAPIPAAMLLEAAGVRTALICLAAVAAANCAAVVGLMVLSRASRSIDDRSGTIVTAQPSETT